MFWEEVKRVRSEMVQDVNGQILRDGIEVRKVWVEYFEQVLNVQDVREANINVFCDRRMPVFGGGHHIDGGTKGGSEEIK